MSRAHDAEAIGFMKAFETSELADSLTEPAAKYREFLRTESMSCGLYRVPKGGTDPQSPHTEDEIYYIVRGRAQINVAREDRSVEPGSIVFVPAHIEHRFHDIQEDLIALVLFAPPEGTSAVMSP